MSWLEEQPIAHRGFHSPEIPENSLAAFQAAIDEGYAIELDVRLIRDGTPVVYHDAGLSRLTSSTGRVSRSTWDDLSTITLLDSDQSIPRLVETLTLVDGQVPLLIELKYGRPGFALERAVTELLDTYDGPFAVQSFNPLTVRYFRKHRPSWSRGQVSGYFEGRDDIRRSHRAVIKRLLPNVVTRPDFVAYEHTRLPYWPVTLHRLAGIPVLAWTIRSREGLREARKYADNVIFEGVRL